PKKCHLEDISFSGNQVLTSGTYNLIATTLNKNGFIAMHPPLNEKPIRAANRNNRKNIITLNQQRCLNQVIDLAHAYTAPSMSKKINFSSIPMDAMLIIMNMLYGKEIQGMDTMLCTRLILSNFVTRSVLISE